MSTLDDRIDTFRGRVVGRPITEGTFEDYQRWIRRFEAWLDAEGRGDPELSDLLDFDTYLNDESRSDYPWGAGRGRPAPASYAYSTRVNAISACKMWIERMYDTHIPEVPEDICYGEPADFDPTYLSFEQVETIIEAADECEYDYCQAALALSYDAILRASELVLVSPDDVSLDGRTLYVTATKGSINTTVGLEPETVERVRPAVEASRDAGQDRLFTNTNGDELTKKAWANHVWSTHTDAGSHAFGRHTPIVHRLEAPGRFETMDDDQDAFAQVFRRARHKHPSMTRRYARVVGVDIPEWAGDGNE